MSATNAALPHDCEALALHQLQGGRDNFTVNGRKSDTVIPQQVFKTDRVTMSALEATPGAIEPVPDSETIQYHVRDDLSIRTVTALPPLSGVSTRVQAKFYGVAVPRVRPGVEEFTLLQGRMIAMPVNRARKALDRGWIVELDPLNLPGVESLYAPAKIRMQMREIYRVVGASPFVCEHGLFLVNDVIEIEAASP